MEPFSAPPLTWRKSGKGRPGDQRSIWLSDPALRSQAAAGVKQHIKEKLQLGSAPYYLQGHAASGKSNFFYVGSAEDIGAAIVIPPWEKSPNFGFHSFDVDHMKEWQLGGANTIDNMWLLDPHLNRSSGSKIMSNIREQVDAYLGLASPVLADPPSRQELQRSYTVTFGRPIPQVADEPKPVDSWRREDIGKGEHVRGLDRVPDKELAGVKGSPDCLVIYQRAGGGRVRRIKLHGRTGDVTEWSSRGYAVTSVTWELAGPSAGSGRSGEIVARVIKDNRFVKDAELRVPIMGMTGVDYGGFVDRETISRMRRGFIEAKGLSPMDFADLDFDFEKGLVGRGVVPKPTVKLLERVQIAVVLEGAEVGVEARSPRHLKLPGPFKVKGGGLTLTASRRPSVSAGSTSRSRSWPRARSVPRRRPRPEAASR